jgi:ribonuclease HII
VISFDAELLLLERGLVAIGVDEAGRGALAGPVVAAAVVLHPNHIPDGINDSKKLRPERRARLAEEIRRCAVAWSIGMRSARIIDEINILQATFEAMHEAISLCHSKLDRPTEACHLLIDGNRFRPHAIDHTTIIGGDATSISIAAASILAKTVRDTYVSSQLHLMYPAYGFAHHKGYGTQMHRDALLLHGPCHEHRLSFLGRILDGNTPDTGADA